MVSFSTGWSKSVLKEGNSIFEGRKNEKDSGLTGSLRDFGLTDLFQVLGQQQKTGVLNLLEEKKSIEVLFDQGRVVGVGFPLELGEETPLGKRLIRGGLISTENWKKVYQQHEEGLLGIEKALVDSGMVTREDLTAALRLLTFDTIYQLFKWKGGTFRFEAHPVSYDHEFMEPLSAEYLLLDVLRMVDEWPMIAERLPSFDMVMQKINPMASLDALNGTPWEKNRTFQMEVIYDLLDGGRSIKEIIELSFVEEFETCKNLIVLMDAGLIEPTTTVSVKKEKIGKREIQVAKYLADTGAYLAVGILALFFLIQLTTTRLPNFPLSKVESQGWRIFQDSLRKVQEAKVKNAQEVFFLEENRYPQKPDEMEKRGLLN